MNKLVENKLRNLIQKEIKNVLNEAVMTSSQLNNFLSTSDKDSKPWKTEFSKLVTSLFRKYSEPDKISIKDKDKLISLLWKLHDGTM